MAFFRGTFRADTFYGTDEADIFRLGAADDFAIGDDGNDVIRGEAGNDTLFGFIGNDYLRGEAGDDTLVGGTGNDLSLGGAGNDRIVDAADRNYLAGQDGFDLLVAAGTENTAPRAILSGGAQADRLEGGIGVELHLGGLGNDSATARGGTDFLFGEGGNDYLDAGVGIGALSGGAGSDRFIVRGEILNNGQRDRIVVLDFQNSIDLVRVGPGVAPAAGNAVQGNVDFAFLAAAVSASSLGSADFAEQARIAGDNAPSLYLNAVAGLGTRSAATFNLAGADQDQIIFVGLTGAQADALF